MAIMHTPVLGLPYPEGTDSADVPRDIKALAEAVEASGVLPAGVIQMWPGNVAPSGWAILNGTSVPEAANPKLAAIFGASGGQVPLPDMRSAVPRGTSALGSEGIRTRGGTNNLTLTSGQLPLHTHKTVSTGRDVPYAGTWQFRRVTDAGVTGMLVPVAVSESILGAVSDTDGGQGLGNAVDVRSASVFLNFIIKLG